MKLQQLKINQYGKLRDKEINLKDNINIIYGKNEAGKSTLLSFIINSFYGISKNKKGKEYSDFEKYEPWVGEDFSGKIKYQLDNGNIYEVQRDFKKKNPKIFNADQEDISKDFPIDKSAGSMFFYEQTKVDEDLFLSTLVANQQETKLQKNEQSMLVQKIANLVGTGEDKVSYKLAIDRLNRRQLEEVGTSRSREKPINIIDRKMQEIEIEKNNLQEYQEKKYETEEKEQQLGKDIKELEQKTQILQEIKMILDEQNQKIDVKENIKKQNAEKIKEIYTRIYELKKEDVQEKDTGKIKSYWKPLIAIIGFFMILNFILQAIFWSNTAISISILVVSIFILGVATFHFSKKQKKEMKKRKEVLKQQEIIKEKQNLLENELQILEKNSQEIEEEITENKNETQKKLLEKYSNVPSVKEFSENNISQEIQDMQNKLTARKMELHALNLDKNTILPNLEKLASLEEEYANLDEEKHEIQKLNTAIETAKSILEKCYEEMRHTVTPKFTQNLSNIISNITNGKYNQVHFHDEDGLIIENEKGEYIPAEKLSVGTIEQLYLSLRLSMIDELSSEELPIILDETFAYFDNERLKNFLEYMYKTYSNRQILIFTCTDREKTIMEQNQIPYNLIEL